MQEFILIFICSFLLCFVIGVPYVKFLTKRKYNQTILEYVEIHSSKKNTPTMGGIMFVLSATIISFIFCAEYNFLLVLSLLVMLGFGLVGFLDDFLKIKFKRNLGLTPWQKILGQGGISVIIALFCYFSSYNITTFIPFSLSTINLSFGIIFVVFFVMLGTVNSVNLIDGLDGLASKVSLVYLVGFGIILQIIADKLYYLGYSEFDVYQLINLSKGCIALSGALLAFLIFNASKAKVFMGDVGSLSLGGFIACAGVLSGLWLYIPLLGFLYVVTALSVIIQVLHYKRTKRRIFLMAPLHHHFEQKGINEQKIVTIYTIISIIIALVCIYFTI